MIKSESLYEYCIKSAVFFIKNNRYSFELLKKEEYNSIEDFAKTCIAYLFVNDGISKAMKLSSDEIKELSKEEYTAKLNSIICTKVKQTISQLVKHYNLDFGYRRISNTLGNFLNCNSEGFKEKSFMQEMIVFRKEEAQLGRIENQIPEEIINKYLSGCKLNNYSAPEILREIFDFVDNQEEYSAALSKSVLIKMIVNIQKERKTHFDSVKSGESTLIFDRTILRDEITEFLLESKQLYGLKYVTRNSSTFFYMGNHSEIRWNLKQIPIKLILIELNNLRIRKNLKSIFTIANSHKDYCNAIESNHLINTLMKIYEPLYE